MGNLTAIDLFSGCGGSALGFRKAGFNILAAIDNDKRSNETYKVNHRDVRVIDSDIRYISGTNLLNEIGLKKGELTIILACPPCQGFSSARNKYGEKDIRNELVFEFVRLTKEIKPKIIAMENVPGLSRGKGKQLFLQAVKQLQSMGYKTVYDVLNSSDYGVPQNRKRTILLGTLLDGVRLSFPQVTHGVKNSLSQRVNVRKTIGDLPEIKIGEINKTDYMHVSARISEKNLKRLTYTPHNGGGWKDWPERLRLDCHKKPNAGHSDVYGRMRWDLPSPTLTAGCVAISKGRFGHPEQNRAISLREAARLQSFPDSHVFKGPFTSIASQIGNAVPPLLAEHIANALIKSLHEYSNMEKIYSRLFSYS